MFSASGLSTLESVLNLVGLIIVFLLILAAAYFLTRWLGKTNFLQKTDGNIVLIESYRINQTCSILIVKIGVKYFAIGVSKDHMEFMTELEEENLNLEPLEGRKMGTGIEFKDVFEKIRNRHMDK